MTEKTICITIKGDATRSFSLDSIKSVLSPFLVVSSIDISHLETKCLTEGNNEPV